MTSGVVSSGAPAQQAACGNIMHYSTLICHCATTTGPARASFAVMGPMLMRCWRSAGGCRRRRCL